MTTQIVSAVPLVRLQVRDVTTVPETGRYYEDTRGNVLLCLGPKNGVYWFIDAAMSPIIMRTAEQLAAAPLRTVDLVPTEAH